MLTVESSFLLYVFRKLTTSVTLSLRLENLTFLMKFYTELSTLLFANTQTSNVNAS